MRAGFRVLAAVCLVLALLGGCENVPLGNDLADAKRAFHNGDMIQAQKLLERHLLQATDPQLRWETWNLLLAATEQGSPSSPWIIDYLDAMLMEFEESPEKSRAILLKQADVHEAARRYERALEALSRLVEEEGLLADDEAAAYRRLGQLSLRMRRFEVAEDYFQSCMALPVSPTRQAECLFDLADAFAMRGDADHAATLAQQVMDMDDADPVLKARAGFILGDIRDEQGRTQEALTLFEGIKGVYPNEMVVDKRIELLKKKPKKTM